MKRVTILLLVVVMLMSFAACAGSDSESQAPGSSAPPSQGQASSDSGGSNNNSGNSGSDTSADNGGGEEEPTPAQPRDLGGIEILVSDWWTNNLAEKAPPSNLREEQQEDYWNEIFEENSFTWKRRSIAGWGDYVETFTTSVMAGEPAADIFIMGDGWAKQLMAQGLLYPLNTLDSFNENSPKWNPIMKDAMTVNGNTYAVTHEKYVEPKNFLFFNKRLFADAGIDPNEIYALQESGDWTWAKFEEYCEKLTRDTDGDGINDTFGFTGFEVEVCSGFIFSNNAQYIGVNSDGTYYNAMNEPNFIEAIQFARSIWEKGYWTDGPEDSSWDWFVTGFRGAYAAMIIREAYSTGEWNKMDDEWGMVYPPKGPKATDYNTYFGENVYCLPFNISKEKAEDLMYAYNLYTEPLPYDADNPDFWKDGAYGYQRFRDARAVDYTMSMFYNGLASLNNRAYVPGIDWGPTFDWGSIFGAETVIEKIEAAKPVVDAAISEANAAFG